MKINPYKYPFIAIDGVDDGGKTTLIEKIQKWDKINKIGAIFTKEPTNGEIGQRIRKILANNSCDEKGEKVSATDLQRLYIKDRLPHRKTEAVWLESNPVFTDRDVSAAFGHGMAEGVDPQWIFSAHELILGDYFFMPDLMLILDLFPEEAIKRGEKSGEIPDYFEREIKLRRKIREAYLRFPAIAEKFYPEIKLNIRIIDASPPPDEIFKTTLPFIEEIFRKKKSSFA
jgi:dTMP kinase